MSYDPDALLSRIAPWVWVYKKRTAGAETDGGDSWGYCVHVFSSLSASILVNKSKLTLTSWYGHMCLYAVFPSTFPACAAAAGGEREPSTPGDLETPSPAAHE